MPVQRYNDRKLTAMMVEDMLFNPLLAAEVIFNVKLPPHEELRIMWMWTTYYTNDDSGFSTGKSWTFALVSALRSILLDGRISGIISKTFAQGKLVFKNFDTWYETCPIFRSQIKHVGGKKRLVHGNDVWQAYFTNESEIRVLPPNFLNDAERIRSERWNDMYGDEWTTYGNFTALNSTIIGRVTRVNNFPDCQVRQNHIHLASTPTFEHHPSFKMVQGIDLQIANGNTNYGRFTCNYRHVPDTDAWKWLVNRKVIFHMQITNPRGIVRTEIDGLWTKDSETYYNSADIDQVRNSNVKPILERAAKSNDIFIAAFDTAAGGGDTSVDGSGDDYSLSVFRIDTKNWVAIHSLTVRFNRISDTVMAGQIHKYHRMLGFSLIVFDPGGGGLFVADKLKAIEQLIDNDKVQCTPIITIADSSGTVGDQILMAFSRGDTILRHTLGKFSSDSVLLNKAHRIFKGAIENKKVLLAGEWDGWQTRSSAWDVDAMREWLNRRSLDNTEERVKAEMDLAVRQLILVDVLRDSNGVPTLDSYGMYKFKSKKKKDSAYSLMYAYFGVEIHKLMMESGFSTSSSADKNSATITVHSSPMYF